MNFSFLVRIIKYFGKENRNMNKLLVTIAASLAVLSVVFAQGQGVFIQDPQEAPRPGQGGFPLGQGGGRQGNGSVVVTANEKYLFVVTGGTIYKYDVESMILKGKAEVPTNQGRRSPEKPNN
jgi:hypothetical protein